MLSVSPAAGPDGLSRTQGADTNLAFRDRGSGPAMVLLHGTSANHAVWEPIAEELAGQARVIALDQRGHGRSDKPPTGYSGADFAGDVITVLDALGIDTAVVGGHSLGARNACMTAALYPDRVAGVLAVDYTPWVEQQVLDVLDERVAAGYQRFDSPEAISRYLTARYRLLPPDAIARRTEWGYHRDTDGTWLPLADPSAMSQLIAGLREPWDAPFRSMTAPATHIRGELSAITSVAAWDAAVQARPEDRWIVDPERDHYVPEEHPDLIVEELRQLLHRSAPTTTQGRSPSARAT